jgi:outer membrane protein, heavy metal efflux system
MRRYSLWMSLALATGPGLAAKADPPAPAPALATAPTPAPNPRGALPVNPLRVPIAAPRTAPGTIRDTRVRPAQAAPGDARIGTVTPLPPLPAATVPTNPAPSVGGQSLSLEAALYGALTSNPDVVTLRNSNIASPEAVEVARRFPTTLNPTLWIDIRPMALERVPGYTQPNGRMVGPHMDHKDALMYFSLRQPIELGHQTTHRHAIARAALSQQQWTVVQAELLALVQTYRFFQTAAYRREKLRVADQLADFNENLLQSLRRRLEANQVQAADVSLAAVENRAARQLVKAARQDYHVALADLRNQIGAPETAGTAEPLGEFAMPSYVPPLEDQALIQMALQSRPEIHAAHAAVAGARAFTNLARADRIPTPVVGPVYERDEQGTQFLGFVYITPIPVINNGRPLVVQREADYRRAVTALRTAEQRVVAQVRAAVAKWNGARELVSDSEGLTGELAEEVAKMERLFEAGQTDLTKLLQARQRLIQLKNAELDALWQATQAQADLLTALGAPTLIASLNQQKPAPAPAPAAVVPASVQPRR